MNTNFPILILDDEKDICLLLTIFLKKKFSVVDSICSIKELASVEIRNYKLIFIDNNLIEGSGFDHILKIKEKNKGIKVVAISAFDTYAEKRLAMEKGADLFLGKPFNHEEILNVINSMLSTT